MVVLVCGSRYWHSRRAIQDAIYNLPHGTSIIHGNCKGADTMAGEAAKVMGFSICIFNADWGRHGLAAGPVRNREMLNQKPDLVIAFHDDINSSKGTRDCVEEAKIRGIPVELWRSNSTHINL